MTGRETDHMHLSGQIPGQDRTNPGLETRQATGIAEEPAERAFPRRGQAGPGSSIAAAGAPTGFIDRHGVSPE